MLERIINTVVRVSAPLAGWLGRRLSGNARSVDEVTEDMQSRVNRNRRDIDDLIAGKFENTDVPEIPEP